MLYIDAAMTETFTVITSSSLTRLAEKLACRIASENDSPLAQQTVVVQSSGMGRWISMELASRNGISAGMQFLYPNTFSEKIVSELLGIHQPDSPYSIENMTWKLMGLLPSMCSEPGFESIRSYCTSGHDGRGMFQLAARIADVFDQYTFYRPALILNWDAGLDDCWQARLWRGLVKDFGPLHRLSLLQQLQQQISTDTGLKNRLPAYIRVFGISYLPPYHLQLLSLLSRLTRIELYMLNPCGEYWGDLISPKRLAAIRASLAETDDALEYYESGNPLLSSLGVMGQEFFNMLVDHGATFDDLDGDYTLPTHATLLQSIQHDILTLNNRSSQLEKGAIAMDDRSIELLACHSPFREMEVLHDYLLDMFEHTPELEPRHIVVMTPDIEAYAPYISAVFGTRHADRPAIPFTIADRSQKNENPDIIAFLNVLELPSGRFDIATVLDLLRSPAVMNRFSINRDELDLMEQWLISANVRWGIDAAHREKLGFTAYAENSWKNALDRMMLGYAMDQTTGELFHDMQPLENVEGRQALALGKLHDFFSRTTSALAALASPQSLSAWADTISNIVAHLLAASDSFQNNLKPVHEALQKLKEIQATTGFDARIGLEVVKDWLYRVVDIPGSAYGFLSGKVTFCAMLPMRSIPFRVICLSGMNDGCFPRTNRQPGFSLMSGKRKRGDKSLRDEDRYLFLEALMSASERLLITYTGLDNRDNSEIPPSVVVDELLDYINAGFRKQDAEPDVVIRHRLQPFSSSYFIDSPDNRLFSYSAANCQALLQKQQLGSADTVFCNKPLPPPENMTGELSLHSLKAFFRNPAAMFLQQRFGVRPAGVSAEIEENESFALDYLNGYKLKQELVEHLLNGDNCDEVYLAKRASSELPPLFSGRIAFEKALQASKTFVDQISRYKTEKMEPLQFSLHIAGITLTGRLESIYESDLLHYRCATMKGRDLLGIWLEQLVYQCLDQSRPFSGSILVCRDRTIRIAKAAQPEAILERLLHIYQQGLLRPLPFFPESAWKYKLKDMNEAQKCWEVGGYAGGPAESADPAFRLCFGRQAALDEEFRQLADEVYGELAALAEKL